MTRPSTSTSASFDKIMQAPNAARSVEIMSLTEYDPGGEYAGARRVDLAD